MSLTDRSYPCKASEGGAVLSFKYLAQIHTHLVPRDGVGSFANEPHGPAWNLSVTVTKRGGGCRLDFVEVTGCLLFMQDSHRNTSGFLGASRIVRVGGDSNKQLEERAKESSCQ